MDTSTFFPKGNSSPGYSPIEEKELLYEKFSPFSSKLNFDAPVKTTEQLRQGLISAMGNEQGQKMYDEFVKSIITMSINTVKKEMERAQRAAKKMRSIYRDLHG